MSIIGGYTLHLYCCCRVCREKKDAAGNYVPSVMHEICEPDKQMAYRTARLAGCPRVAKTLNSPVSYLKPRGVFTTWPRGKLIGLKPALSCQNPAAVE
jgi:hypothetical protein